MSRINPIVVALLLLMGLGQYPLQAQQVMPRLIRQIAKPPTLDPLTNGMAEDATGTIWLATANGVTSFDGRRFQTYHDPDLPQGDFYYDVMPSPDGRIWCKPKTGNTLTYIDRQANRMVRLPDSTPLVKQYLAEIGCNYVYVDAEGFLWVGLRGRGLLRVNPRTYAVDHVITEKLHVRWITQDRRGLIWFTTVQGVYNYDPATRQSAYYGFNALYPAQSLSEFYTLGIKARPDGTIVVGLDNQINLITPATGAVGRVSLIPSTHVFSVQEIFDFHLDSQGNTYFLTHNGVFRYRPQGQMQRVEFNSPMHPIQSIHTSQARGTNRLWISWGASLCEYDLNQVRAVPALNLLDVFIDGIRLETSTTDQRLERDSLGHPTLRVWDADSLTLRFAPRVTPQPARFRYRLLGTGQPWQVVTGVDVTVGYDLSPGSYRLQVNQRAAAGVWSEAMATLTIEVNAPVWKKAWFWALILLMSGGLAYWAFQSWHRRQQLRQQLTRREFEAATLRQVDELKTRFFANITHEFRTPLTLILAPTQQLQQAYPQPDAQRALRSIEKNAYQLLELINQLLDLSRLESKAMAVNESRGEPGPVVGGILQSFQGQAEAKQITLRYQHELPGDYWFDQNKLERIVYNLVANALKFTPAGGSVQVALRAMDSGVQISVADTGIGIAADQVPHIFDRFFQVDDSSTKQSEGTGIGLSLVHELVVIQGGQIEVRSAVGTGTTFVVQLPYRSVPPATSPDAPAMPAPPPTAAESLSARADYENQPLPTDRADSQPVVLLVEDNDELADFILRSLPPLYQTYRAANGADGIEQALALVPDLILSDVLMPLMDGFEMTRRLKTDQRTNHIPIVLLTAKAAVDSLLQGLSLGADDYLTKPFLVSELQLRVRNRLERQQRQRDRLKTQLNTLPGPAQEPGIEGEPDPFMEQIYRILDSKLDDSSFGAEELAIQVGMSRGHLYRKLKALTDLSVNEVIRNYRLNRASEYLRLGRPIAETGYLVGFESPSYFTKCFRELYGLPPSDYSARPN
ncbi:response regulator [Spirosoma sp. BT702]|uniref:histidine kinase n=1 Tax=Spirosoma profusum TaxID=2771354 RepID=A0A927GAQ6_9BACT|nr:ATP-binding protein [Spirosoma profusum]MBD2705742.1 response regulator [Spirosoma profusum]